MRKNRILFLISTQHFKIAGGIGQFFRGLNDHAEELDCYIDIVFDQKPAANKIIAVDNLYYYPDDADALSYRNHRKFFVFKDGINYEMVVNFRNSITKALRENLYTHIISNTPEATIALKMVGVKNTKTMVYSHIESYMLAESELNRAPTFTLEFLQEVRNLKGITIGCQTYNMSELVSKFTDTTRLVLPFFFPKNEKPVVTKEGKGVLFIGRWEDRKNPKAFVKLIKDTGLPAKVMTNRNGKEKFVQALSEIGADFEVQAEIFGEEKSRFISSAKIAFAPNLIETGPYSVYESLVRVKTIVPVDRPWAGNFRDLGVIYMDLKEKDFASRVKDIYYSEEEYTPAVDFSDLNALALKAWREWMKIPQDRSHRDFKNEVFREIQSDKTLTPEDIIPADRFNQTSLNQLTEAIRCHDLNVRFTSKKSYISTSEIQVEDNTSEDNAVDLNEGAQSVFDSLFEM